MGGLRDDALPDPHAEDDELMPIYINTVIDDMVTDINAAVTAGDFREDFFAARSYITDQEIGALLKTGDPDAEPVVRISPISIESEVVTRSSSQDIHTLAVVVVQRIDIHDIRTIDALVTLTADIRDWIWNDWNPPTGSSKLAITFGNGSGQLFEPAALRSQGAFVGVVSPEILIQ